jgi:hypothetical protein
LYQCTTNLTLLFFIYVEHTLRVHTIVASFPTFDSRFPTFDTILSLISLSSIISLEKIKNLCKWNQSIQLMASTECNCHNMFPNFPCRFLIEKSPHFKSIRFWIIICIYFERSHRDLSYKENFNFWSKLSKMDPLKNIPIKSLHKLWPLMILFKSYI